MKRFILTLCVAFLCSYVSLAEQINIQQDNFRFCLNDEDFTATVLGRWGEQVEDLVIPEKIEHNSNTYTVTSINDHAFMSDTSIVTLTLPGSLTGNSYSPFYMCSNLKTINFQRGLKRIYTLMFSGCIGLEKVTLPEGLAIIGEGAFSGCTNLKEIYIPNSVTTIEDYAFHNCTSFPVVNNLIYVDNYLVGVADNTLSTYSIKEGTKYIGGFAFEGCVNLTSVNIPNSVTDIQAYAFVGCTSLTNLSLHEGLTRIAFGTFQSCTNLTSISLPNSIKSIEWSAFAYCSSLAGINIPDGVTEIGEYAFQDCTSLAKVNLPNSLSSLGMYAFSGCTALTEISIPGRSKYYHLMCLRNAAICRKPLLTAVLKR